MTLVQLQPGMNIFTLCGCLARILLHFNLPVAAAPRHFLFRDSKIVVSRSQFELWFDTIRHRMSSTFDLCLFAKQHTFPVPPGIEVNGKGGLVDTPASQSDTVESMKLHPLNNRPDAKKEARWESSAQTHHSRPQ